MPPVNQDLIAAQLNISRSTVSRSLANHPAISVETRAQVHRLAGKLGYRPSRGRAFSRHPGGSRTMTVGVLFGAPRENGGPAAFPDILKGVYERAEADRVKVDVYYQVPDDLHPEQTRQAVFRHIRLGDWRGMILVHPFAETAVEMISRKISTVAVLENYHQPGIDIIDADDASAVLALVALLQAAGHQRIGFISRHPPVGGHSVAKRFGGYVEALVAHRLEFHPKWVINMDRNAPPLNPAEVADTVIGKMKVSGITAWVCAAEHQAHQLVQDLQARGIRVPEDCSLTGFGGLTPTTGQRQVTSMRASHEHIGFSALGRLINRMENPAAPRRKILVETQLVPGETIATPRPGKLMAV